MNLRVRPQVNVSYFNYFSLFTCQSLCRQDHAVCRLFMVLHTSCFYRSRNLQLRPRLQVSVFIWKRSFFPSGSAYRLHVTSEDAHGKRVFSKPLSRVEIFEKAVSCGTSVNGMKTERLLRRIPSRCWIPWPVNAHSPTRVTIFSHISFSFGHLETIEKTQRVDGDFLNTEKKNLHFRTKTNPCGQGLREIRNHSVCRCGVAAL